MITNYELFALRYARRDARRADHFLDAIDDPERPMPMDYFVWVARSPERTVLIESGFKHRRVGERRGRKFIRRPLEALPMIGADPARIDS